MTAYGMHAGNWDLYEKKLSYETVQPLYVAGIICKCLPHIAAACLHATAFLLSKH